MGGMNSGRRDQGGKNTTEDCRVLDVRYLQRGGLLSAGRSFGLDWTRNGEKVASIQVRAETDRVILDYRHQRNGSEWKSVNYPVRIEWTPCNYGGSRAWFRCPADGCTRRVAKLFLGSSGIFACRHCYQLAYASQRESVDDRATRRADRIRARLGWEPGILNGNGGKPKGMRLQTFMRLTAEHDAFVGVSLAVMERRFGVLRESILEWD
jgi:hypothetical protein